MQEHNLTTLDEIEYFITTMSNERFSRYLNEVNGKKELAIELYHWNIELAKSLYSSLQMWEIALRNKLNNFLCWKYNNAWPYDETRAIRQLANNDRVRVKEAIERQQQLRGIKSVPTGAIVADLSAGFWVSLLNTGYDVPFAWRYNIRRIFPCNSTITRKEAAEICNSLVDLRNRVAHHEPIYHLQLDEYRAGLGKLLNGMCVVTAKYADHTCTFSKIWRSNPLS